MHSKEEIQLELDKLKREYGEWTYDIPLPFDIWTRGNLQIPHIRLRRIIQAASDLSKKPLSECRILDLGCLDGLFSIEFAKHGADTIGIEIREANIKKAIFCRDVLALQNLDFRLEDVRHISLESHGKFDAIICSGILYHLPGPECVNLIDRMFEMVNRMVVIDTHVALDPSEQFVLGGHEYHGKVFREHPDNATPEEKAKNLWASFDNPTSFWFTRPSLINLLSKAGFSSVYECFVPAHLNFGKTGLECQDRCTFVALKENICHIEMSPSVNILQENFPEHSLTYAPVVAIQDESESLYRRAISHLKKIWPTIVEKN